MKCKRCGKEIYQVRPEFGLDFEVDDRNGYTRGFILCKECALRFERFLMSKSEEG